METLDDIINDLMDKKRHSFHPKTSGDMSLFLTNIIRRLDAVSSRLKSAKADAAMKAAADRKSREESAKAAMEYRRYKQIRVWRAPDEGRGAGLTGRVSDEKFNSVFKKKGT